MPDNELNLPFPTSGVDVSCEFQSQPEGTCADALNVRSRDTLASRVRGGSRPGLTRYVDEIVPGWVDGEKIQHLGVLVDPTTDALRQNFDTPQDDWTTHPRFAVQIPPRGGADQPNPNATQPVPPPVTPALRQAKILGYEVTNAEQSLTFDSDPLPNTLLVAIAVTSDTAINTLGLTVTDGVNAAYTQAGSYRRMIKVGQEHTISMWYKTADGTTAANREVQIDPTGDCTMCLAILEITGCPTTSQLDSTSGAVDSVGSNPMAAGPVSILGNNEIVVAGFLAMLSPDTITPSAGFTIAVEHPDGTIDATDIQLYVTYKLDCDLASDPDPQATFTGGADKWAAIAASFKD